MATRHHKIIMLIWLNAIMVISFFSVANCHLARFYSPKSTAGATVQLLGRDNDNAQVCGLKLNILGRTISISKTKRAGAKKIEESEKKTLTMSLIPIKKQEWAQFGSLSAMMFLVVFVYTVTRNTKDALVVTACGAEAISFLKVYGVLPAAALFMLAYGKLSTIFGKTALFYSILIPFFLFYLLFGYVLYPMRFVLHPALSAWGGDASRLSAVVDCLRNWTLSLFYVISELWASAGVPLLFWTCANDVLSMEQARRMYPFLSLLGNVGAIVGGLLMARVGSHVSLTVSNDELAFEKSIQILTLFMTAAGCAVGLLRALVYYLHDQTGGKKEASPVPSKKKVMSVVVKDKAKPSMMDSMKILSSNPILQDITVLVLAYGLTIEFTGILFKASCLKAFPAKNDYLKFMGVYSTLTGISASVMTFLGSVVIRKMGWRAGAMMTPWAMGILSLPFFLFLMGQSTVEHLMKTGFLSGSGVSSRNLLMAAVWIGVIQSMLCKAMKYSSFDPTKEMAYMTLDTDAKTKGKAAIDVFAARLGKSGAAAVQQVLVVVFGSIMNGTPILCALLYAVIFAWIRAIWRIDKQIQVT